MVIHDMRSPNNSAEFGIIESLNILRSNLTGL
jgi:hypothetical protein